MPPQIRGSPGSVRWSVQTGGGKAAVHVTPTTERPLHRTTLLSHVVRTPSPLGSLSPVRPVQLITSDSKSPLRASDRYGLGSTWVCRGVLEWGRGDRVRVDPRAETPDDQPSLYPPRPARHEGVRVTPVSDHRHSGAYGVDPTRIVLDVRHPSLPYPVSWGPVYPHGSGSLF